MGFDSESTPRVFLAVDTRSFVVYFLTLALCNTFSLVGWIILSIVSFDNPGYGVWIGCDQLQYFILWFSWFSVFWFVYAVPRLSEDAFVFADFYIITITLNFLPFIHFILLVLIHSYAAHGLANYFFHFYHFFQLFSLFMGIPLSFIYIFVRKHACCVQ